MALTNNKKIKIFDFSQISEYLYDDYLEYIKRIDINFINTNIENFLKNIIQNEQIELLKYVLDNCKYEKISVDEIINVLVRYKGKNNPQEILEILLNKIPNLKSCLLTRTKNYFNEVISDTSLEFTKQVLKLLKTNNISVDINQYKFKPYCFIDKRNFYWLVDKKIINCNTCVINLLIEELYSSISNINKDNIEYLLEKINFNKNELYKIFIVTKDYYYYDGDRYLLNKLIVCNKNDLIYYFFKLLKPEEIINKDKVKDIFKKLIMFSDYDMFMFIMKNIILLKYDDFLDDSEYINKCFGYTITDKKIIYELVKLGCKIDKSLKYYNDFNNIQIIKDNKK